MSTNYVEEASFIEEEGILAFADEEKVGGVNQTKAAVSGADKSSTDAAEETAAAEEKPAVGDAETVHTHVAPKVIDPDQKAIVEQSSWWPATSDQEITFKPGEAVRVIAIDNVTLIVEG
ncbi:MAG: hypothetical protein EAZ79_20555 [Oscillatoriales cyanobacterium]|nr:MAG: hypothetical protein EAZ79_20555 [Oscillatoriales cyanobacterium]